MESKVSVKELIFMICIIVSFFVTAILIMQGYDDYSLVALSCAALSVLLEFCAITSDNSSRIIDLSSAALRASRVTSASGKIKTRKRNSGNIDFDMSKDYSYENMSDDGTFYESVGNLKVYKPGEKVVIKNSDDK